VPLIGFDAPGAPAYNPTPMLPAFDPGNRLVFPLDVSSAAEAEALVARTGAVPAWMKVGLELFCAAGPGVVRDLVGRGTQVMLDLKLHDIPETVARATREVGRLGAGLLTVHAGGGRAMLEAAVAAARATGATRILAVTVLTSLDEADLADVGAIGPAADLVLRRARLAIAAGCDGVVASPHEAAAIRALAPAGFLVVTPGVRPAGAEAGDQKRITTPAVARGAGADLLVVGRPIRDAADPAAAARAIAAEIAAADGSR
jgi:orotidine-5'-phosphate decarboxylase